MINVFAIIQIANTYHHMISYRCPKKKIVFKMLNIRPYKMVIV